MTEQGNIKLTKNMEKIAVDLYTKVANLRGNFDSIRNEIYNLINDPNIKDLCDAPETLSRINAIISEITNLTADLTSISSSVTQYYELLKTAVMEIILKEIEILKLECESLILFTSTELAKFIKEEMVRMLDGEGTAAVVTVSAPMSAKIATAQAISKITLALDLALSALYVVPLFGIDGGAMVLSPTPKSIIKLVSVIKMSIVNPGNSIGNTLGESIESQISNAIESFNVTLGNEKIVKIADAAAQGASTITTSTGLTLIPLGKFKKIDAAEILKLVNNTLALSASGAAEPLPRYEKLNIINLRYMLFLITGFVPAGFQAFGIPNFP